MPHLPTVTLTVLLSAIATGCTGSTSTTVTTVTGDTVTNADGIGTGLIAGVPIEVRGLTSGEATVRPGVQTLAGPSGNYTRELWEITLGDVEIVFERRADEPIELTVNGSFYGMIQPGDELLIDEQRSVFVNGVARATATRDFRDPVLETGAAAERPGAAPVDVPS